MGYEIRNCNLDDVEKLKLLWQDVFHDDEKYIDRFFNKIFSIDNAFVAVDFGMPVAMLFMLPATLTIGDAKLKAGYIYAVATDKNYRKQGIMSDLERHVCEVAVEKGISALALVPATKQLFNMYKKIGYQTAFSKSTTIITSQSVDKYELLNCSVECFLNKRKNMLTEHNAYFELNAPCTEYRYEILQDNGEILIYKDEIDCGYIVGIKKGSEYTILETSLPYTSLGKAAFAIGEKYYKLKKISLVGKTGALTSYGMLKSLDNRINIFDITALNPYMNLMLE